MFLKALVERNSVMVEASYVFSIPKKHDQKHTKKSSGIVRFSSKIFIWIWSLFFGDAMAFPEEERGNY